MTHHCSRRIFEGDEYTVDEDVVLDEQERRLEPLLEIQGEPWGWTKPGPRPEGWPGPLHSINDPGPFDGAWEPLR